MKQDTKKYFKLIKLQGKRDGKTKKNIDAGVLQRAQCNNLIKNNRNNNQFTFIHLSFYRSKETLTAKMRVAFAFILLISLAMAFPIEKERPEEDINKVMDRFCVSLSFPIG